MAAPALGRALSAAAAALLSSADELNRLDGFAGDGDLGITMSEVARVLDEQAAGAAHMEPAELLRSCGAAVARRAPSTSGTLTATAFLRAAKAVEGDGGSGLERVAACFTAAMEGVQARGKASLGDRTVLDGLDAVCTSLKASVKEGSSLAAALRAGAEAASRFADASASMAPKTGRASWMAERALGHPDAGCQALAIALQAVAVSFE